jgi:hypothetical protein
MHAVKPLTTKGGQEGPIGSRAPGPASINRPSDGSFGSIAGGPLRGYWAAVLEP